MKIEDIIKTDKAEKFREVLGDKYDAFVEFLKDDTAFNVVPYSRFKEVNDSRKNLETETNNLKTQLTKLAKDKNITPEDFEKKKQEIIGDYNNKLKEAEKKLSDFKRDTYIRNRLKENNCKYDDLIFSKIDLSKIEATEDGKYKYLDEQIEDLKKNYADLFNKEDGGGLGGDDGIHRNDIRPNSNILAEKLGMI